MKASYTSAVADFHRARRQATLQQILARLTGRSADLLSYDEVRHKLQARQEGASRLKDIPLDAIVGSVGRYTDFTRSFLPRRDSDRDRWARVKVATTDLSGLPPIEVYQIGQVYFVRDGNHRVSVARQLGATHIQAYVTQVHTKVPLSPDVQPDDLILKAGYVQFLKRTHLDELRPGADLSVTAPGKDEVLLEHIDVHRYFMGLEQQREIPYEEAVTHFYDTVYLPIAQVIRERGILRDFPGRTETDLYLWISEHRAALADALGWDIKPEAAADDLATQFSPTLQRIVARVGQRIRDAVTPDELEAGPRPGRWRTERVTPHKNDRLFNDVLVAINGEEGGWRALEQALMLAQRERSQIHGLYVEPSQVDTGGGEDRTARAEFDRRCQVAGFTGGLAIETGEVSHTICDRARWADLVVLSLNHPPEPQPIARLGSGFRTIIHRCPRPILAVPGTPTHMERPLLAYDGSPKAEEALFIATYLSGRWDVPLVVVTVTERGRTAAATLGRAQRYLETHGVHATFVRERRSVPQAILKAAAAHGCDLILMGGYGFSPVLEVVLGSAVDRVLRASKWPILICR